MRRRRLVPLALLAAWLATAGPAQSAPLAFGLFGDTPYNRWEREHLPALIEEMDRDQLAVLIHVGDIKAGSAECSDAAFRDILGVFQAARTPLVYLPGDNEWTDCHRRSNGGYDPEERLATLRRLFHATPDSLGQRRIALERQEGYPENARWEAGGVLFLTLNVQGSHNGYGGYRGDGRGGSPTQEFVARNAANRQWLSAAFARAREKQLPGLLIAIQGNPEFEAANAGHTRPGYRDFITQLREETTAYAGQVVLVHGDTHHQQIDQPMTDPKTKARVENFTRVETFGSPFFGWIRGTADTRDPRVFRFEARPWRAPSGVQ